jgi:hypothetical protein
MLRRKCVRLAAAVTICCLPGCGALDWSNRYGPSPVIEANPLVVSTTRQAVVMDQLIIRAGIPTTLAFDDSRWFFVMEAGFNYVDEECDKYLRALFIMDRERDRVKGALVLADKASHAILDVTSASQKSISIVAQSFGLASGLTDVFADSYLFHLGPAVVQPTVVKLQTAYRNAVTRDRLTIKWQSTAFMHVQRYLSICLPSSIQGNINEYIAKASGGTEKPEGLVVPARAFFPADEKSPAFLAPVRSLSTSFRPVLR